jgi:Pyruvate/2-oxoacid:ferredoxin oxidoreductase delta subunit
MHLAKADPMRVPYLAVAREMGVGETRIDRIEVIGDKVEALAVDDFRMPRGGEPSALFSWGAKARRVVTATPTVDQAKCVGCAQCARTCPPQVIKMVKGKASIDYSSCIRCYCCHEMCPEGAIQLRRGGIARLTERVLDGLNRR